MAKRKEILFCSFCRKDQHHVQKLIAGPAVFICDECVGLCNQIMVGAEIPEFPSWDEMSDETLLTLLAPTLGQVDGARDLLQKHVDLLRKRRVSWGKIGEALGVSRQAAWERFG